MEDEYHNSCDYDFKNILFKGDGTLFDSDKFYYTFTNRF
jgi:hypothetical protein